eukprot:702937-Amphidinium_carterae.4
MRQFEIGAFARVFCKASKKLRKSRSCADLQLQVAWPRAAFSRQSFPRRHIAVPGMHAHAGGCCACFELHTGHGCAGSNCCLWMLSEAFDVH